MAANSVAMRFDGFVYTVGSAVALAGMSFVGQNVGARKPDRVVKSIKVAVGLSTAMSLSLGVVFLLFSDSLCGLISSNPEVIAIAKSRLTFYCLTYFITSIMEILASSLTALGYAKNNVCVGFIVGLCLRAGYVLFLWPSFGTLMSLYAVVPITSLLACTEYLIALKKLALPKLRKRVAEEEAAKQLQNA
jgi:Na+-driven multidrug efflux pump